VDAAVVGVGAQGREHPDDAARHVAPQPHHRLCILRCVSSVCRTRTR
jgi:hypothetical protein